MIFLNKFLFFIVILIVSCNNFTAQEDSTKINFKVNYNIINKNGADEKKILTLWEEFLNTDNVYYGNTEYWLAFDAFPFPNRFLQLLGDIKTHAAQSQGTVIALYPIQKDTFLLKTMFTFNATKEKMMTLDNILNVIAVKTS